MKTLKWIGRTLNKRIWLVAVISILQSLLAISSIAFALIMRQAIDNATAGNYPGFKWSVIMLVVLIAGQVALRWLNRFFEDDTRAAIENRLRQKAFQGILRADYGKIKEYHTGELMNRITSDASVVTEGAVTLVPSLLAMVVRILGVLIVMGAIGPEIALVFLAGGCIVVLLSIAPRKWQKMMHKEVQEADGQVRSFLQESLESLLVIHAFGSEKKIESVSDDKMTRHRKVRRKRSHVFNLFGTGMRIFFQCGYIFGFVWCGAGILEGRISYGTLTAVIQLIGQIQAPFASIGGIFPQYVSMLASAERLMEITERAAGESKSEQKWRVKYEM